MTIEERLPKRKRHRLPMAAYATTEYEYSFTVCARHQGQPFRNTELADAVIDSLLWTRNHYHWLLFCYCLMPDHLHFVCKLTGKDVKLLNAGARGVQPEGALDHVGSQELHDELLMETGFYGQAVAEEQLRSRSGH